MALVQHRPMNASERDDQRCPQSRVFGDLQLSISLPFPRPNGTTIRFELFFGVLLSSTVYSYFVLLQARIYCRIVTVTASRYAYALGCLVFSFSALVVLVCRERPAERRKAG